MTGIGPGDWLATVMVQAAWPEAVVVAGQDWAVAPVPSVKVTARPEMGVFGAGSSVTKVPESAKGCPFCAVAGPV